MAIFNDSASHYSGSCIFGYNSAPAAAKEVFKPSTDSASLVVSSQKKNFQFWFRGSFGGGVTSGDVFAFLWPTLTGPGRQLNGPTFSIEYFYETRISHETLEPLIGFLAYLDQNVCYKNQKLVKISTPKKLTKGKITPCLDMAISRH